MDTDDTATGRSAESPATTGGLAATGDHSDGWLSAALADLDRALRGVGIGAPSDPEPSDPEHAPAPASEPVSGPAPGHDGCTVIIDIAREGRRFAGRRAGAVIRGVADRLTDQLPPVAGLRFGESDTLEIGGPGWTRSDATDWMHRALPGLLDGFVAEEDLPSAQLRAAVHDVDGPVGAQVMQNLASPPSGGRGPDADDGSRRAERDLGPRGARTDSEEASEARAREYRAAARSSLPGRGDRTGTGRSGHAAEPQPAEHGGHGDSGGWPWSGATGPTDREDPAGELSTDVSDEGRFGRRSGSGLVPADLVTAGWASGGVNGRSADPSGVHGSATGEPGTARAGRVDEAGVNHHGADRHGGAAGEYPPATGPGPTRAERTEGDATAGTGRANGRAATGVTGSGARHTGDGRGAHPEPDVDGRDRAEKSEAAGDLGIADLLAGALAAYRKI